MNSFKLKTIDLIYNNKTNLLFLLATILFIGAYGQLPIFSSNQYTYLLPGVALSETSNLDNDWLVNCTNPIPVFTIYTFLIIKLFSLNYFYFVHSIFIGIFFLSLIWIIKRHLNINSFNVTIGMSIVIITFLNADFVNTLLNKTNLPVLSLIPEFIKYTTEGVANQALLRHFHQPSTFGIFLLLSVCFFLNGRHKTALIIVALTPWFHAVYFLPSFLMIITYLFLEYKNYNIFKLTKLFLITIIILLPPLFYVILNFVSTSPDLSYNAKNILINKRIPHHANPKFWFKLPVIFQMIWIIIGIFLTRKNHKLFSILSVMFLFSFLLTILQIITKNETLAMIMPWRISVILMPISSAIIIGEFSNYILHKIKINNKFKNLFLFLCFISLLILFISGLVFMKFRIQNKNNHNKSLIKKVEKDCNCEDVYLINPDWMWFRLSTKCPIYIDWKSHPYRDIEVIEWYKRVQLAKSFYNTKNNYKKKLYLNKIQKNSNITHIVVNKKENRLTFFTNLKKIYSDEKYIIYKLE